MEVDGSAVVAKPRPLGDDITNRSTRTSRDGGKPLKKLMKKLIVLLRKIISRQLSVHDGDVFVNKKALDEALRFSEQILINTGLIRELKFELIELQKNVFVVISDGELNEGTTWESLAIASQLKLSNLTLIIDANGIQSFGKTNEILNLEPLANKLSSFGWSCHDVDGHSIPLLFEALESNSSNKPKVVIARTIKGKGVKEMEGKLEWHYRSPKSEDLEKFISEVSK